jgi:two-component system chemotaxis sensor kinase CheA
VAHSIKGGSATFGFSEIASFTHSLETLLDELRANRLQVTEETSDLLLKSVDAMRDMLRAVQAKKPIDSQRVADLQFDTEKLLAQRHAAANGAAAQAPAVPQAAPSAVAASAAPATNAPATSAAASIDAGVSARDGASTSIQAQSVSPAAAQSGAPAAITNGPAERRWTIAFRPYRELFARGNDPLRMLRELHELGTLTVEAIVDGLPSFDELDTQSCYLAWNLELAGNVDEAAIKQVFDWAEGDCDLVITDVTHASPAGAHSADANATGASAAGAPAAAVEDHTNYDLIAEFDAMMAADAAPKYQPVQAAAPASSTAAPASSTAAPAATSAPAATTPAASAAPAAATQNPAGSDAPAKPAEAKSEPTISTEPAHAPEKVSKSETAAASGIGDSGSIRVSVEKIDELMNTVGELVITQSMLSQLGRNLEGGASEQFRLGLAELERNMRELQDSVMRVRMLPISYVFSRFPRMVRDLAQRHGKQIEFTMTGEQTELDKTVLEKIGDPLVHLVRNSIDHGIEKPDVRVQRGKTPTGHLRLDACHRGGNICVEVSDDGGGMDPQKIMSKARSRGLLGANETLSDDQAVELIFMPGFSTAETTTDVSGRGVGLDVVRRNVKELGGSIDIRNAPGQGARFIITLPLTLAIVDGQSIAVGKQSYIVPLISIIESLQIKQGALNRVAGRGEVFTFRGDYVPVIRLHELFGVEPRTRELDQGLIVIVEGEGRRVGLFVDDLLGQQQVVIKSLETNYGHIDGVSGATILGDGSVALILDLPGIIRRAGAGVRAN